MEKGKLIGRGEECEVAQLVEFRGDFSSPIVLAKKRKLMVCRKLLVQKILTLMTRYMIYLKK